MSEPQAPVAGAAAESDFRDVPSARRVLGRAFDLDLRASRELRNASLFMAAQFLFVVGPLVVVLAALLIRLPELLDAFDPTLVEPPLPEDLPLPDEAVFGQIALGALIATLGWIAITIESIVLAITVLGGRLIGRPVTLREAVTRSRQVFWRVIRAAILVGIPAGIAGGAVGAIFGANVDPSSEALTLVSLVVGILVATPFAYVQTGIVLGDVGAREAIVRGFRLVQARWRLGLVIATFTAAAQYLQLFALGAGGDILFRVGTVLELGFDRGALTTVVTYGAILAGTLAFGTLLFTTIAIAVAPQVVAFVSLTHVTVGLDRAREAVAGTPSTRPVSPTTVTEPTMPTEPTMSTEPTMETDPTVPAELTEPTTSTDPTLPDGPAPPSAPVAPRVYWDQQPAPSGRARLVSLPMLVGGVLAVLLGIAALDGISRIG